MLEFRDLGGEQAGAYRLLESLRTHGDANEEFVLEVMDIVSGWCQPELRIWDSTLN